MPNVPVGRYDFGDVVLVPFPFTNQVGIKKRPAVVVSGRAYNDRQRDVVLMAITSQVQPTLGFAEAMVNEWNAAGLFKLSVFKPVFTTIEKALIVRSMGALTSTDVAALRALMSKVFG